MPKELTHILFADALVGDLDQAGRKQLVMLLRHHRPTLHFGSIATDTLFYKLTIPLIDRDYAPWGEIIHGGEGEDTGTPIREMLSRLQSSPTNDKPANDEPANDEDDARFAFVCGFLTHMALDIVFHPWVYAVSGPYYHPDPDRQADSQMRHRLIESWLDLLMLKRNGKSLAGFDPWKPIRANRRTNLDCLDFFADSFRKAWRIDGDVRRYIRRFYAVQMALGRLFPSQTAAKSIAFANRLAGGRLRAFTALFYPTQPDPLPAGLFDFQGFHHPVTGQPVASTLDRLWNDARELGTALLIVAEAIRTGESPSALDAILAGRSLNIGLPNCPADRATHFKIFPVERMWGYPGPVAGIAP
jgi:hypothetical protein